MSYLPRFVFALLTVVAASSRAIAQTTAPSAKQPITASVSDQRDAYWDAITGTLLPQANGPGCGGDEDMAWEPSDISRHIPKRVIIAATLKGFQLVPSKSQLSYYVDETLWVDQVFHDRSGSTDLRRNREISLLSYGGPNTIPQSRGWSRRENECQDVLKVGHEYLLVLSYQSDGDFFEIFDSWDISDGIVRANGSRDRYLANEGISALNGRLAVQLDEALQKLLKADQN